MISNLKKLCIILPLFPSFGIAETRNIKPIIGFGLTCGASTTTIPMGNNNTAIKEIEKFINNLKVDDAMQQKISGLKEELKEEIKQKIVEAKKAAQKSSEDLINENQNEDEIIVKIDEGLDELFPETKELFRVKTLSDNKKEEFLKVAKKKLHEILKDVFKKSDGKNKINQFFEEIFENKTNEFKKSFNITDQLIQGIKEDPFKAQLNEMIPNSITFTTFTFGLELEILASIKNKIIIGPTGNIRYLYGGKHGYALSKDFGLKFGWFLSNNITIGPKLEWHFLEVYLSKSINNINKFSLHGPYMGVFMQGHSKKGNLSCEISVGYTKFMDKKSLNLKGGEIISKLSFKIHPKLAD